MSEGHSTYTKTPASNRKMLQAMVGIGLLCALLIVSVFEGTKERIAQNKAEALEKAVFKVLPGIVKSVPYELDQNEKFILSENEEEGIARVYAGFDEQDELVGIAVSAGGQGYADIIRVLYGYDPEGEHIVGMYVLESKETPGLGDKIEKDEAFLENFIALDVSLNENGDAVRNIVIPVKSGNKENPWEVDGITGATISSRAIGNILGSSSAHWVPLLQQQKDVFKAIISQQE